MGGCFSTCKSFGSLSLQTNGFPKNNHGKGTQILRIKSHTHVDVSFVQGTVFLGFIKWTSQGKLPVDTHRLTHKPGAIPAPEASGTGPVNTGPPKYRGFLSVSLEANLKEGTGYQYCFGLPASWP